MSITILNNDGTTLNPVFDPAHRDAVTRWYNGLMACGLIANYWINN